GKVDSDDFSHKKWALACANAQNQTHYLSYKPRPHSRALRGWRPQPKKKGANWLLSCFAIVFAANTGRFFA
ncbi:MAG: hypothetical protein UD304_04285, partial [Slackia isoflavoniconvertens]|nr:hypothetical protein [Slackia isoflavoniconvertens]